MKKLIAVALSAIVLVGCGESNKTENYDCGSFKVELSGEKAIVDSNGKAVYEKVGPNLYETTTPAGKAVLNKDGNKFTINVSYFTVTKECKVIEG